MTKVLKFKILYEIHKNEYYYYLLNTIINDKDEYFLLYEYYDNHEKNYTGNVNKYFELELNIVNNNIILPQNIYKIYFNDKTTGFYFYRNKISLSIRNSFNEFKIEIPKIKKILCNIN